MRRGILVLLAACGGDDAAGIDAPPPPIDSPAGYVPAAAYPISHMDPGNDEDPAVLRVADGSILVAWYSQNAADRILISRTTDGVTWTIPTHVSAQLGKNFGPALAQDASGKLHAVWFRWLTGAPPGKIVHASSTDGITWSGETDVTTASATDDWVPSIAVAPDGALVVAFARNTCPPPNTCYGIATSRSTDGGMTWSTPALPITAGNGFEHHLPALVNMGSDLALAWSPYRDTAGAPWESVQSGARISTTRSPQGTTWSQPDDITQSMSDAISTFPSLYRDHAGVMQLVYLQATAGGQSVVERPLVAGPGALLVPLPLAGYSPKVVATPTPGVFLGAYVGGPDGQREVYVQVFDRSGAPGGP